MFDILTSILASDKIESHYEMELFPIKNYILLENDNEEGRDFNFTERANVGYEEKSNEDDLYKLLIHDTSGFTLVGVGKDSLSFSPSRKFVGMTVYSDTECMMVDNPTKEDIIENIPFFKNVIIFNITGLKEFPERRPEAVLTKLISINELLKDKDDTIIIIKREKTIFYI